MRIKDIFYLRKRLRLKGFLIPFGARGNVGVRMTVVKGIVWMQIRECNVNKPIRSRIYIYKYIV